MKNFAVFIGSVLLSLAVAEAAVRAAGFAPREIRINPFFEPNSETTWSVPDEELGWLNMEGVSTSIEDGNARMTFWSAGRRATRAIEVPPENALPVMIVGGSNAQSYGVVDEASFAYRLGERFPDLWIENFGNGGYNTVQSFLLAKRAIRNFYTTQKPKLVLLAFDDSHAVRNVADQSWIYSISDDEGRYVAPPHYRMENEEIVFHPFTTIGFWPLERSSALVTMLHNTWLQSVAYNSAAEAESVTRHVIAQMAEFVSSQDMQFAAVVLEDKSQIADDLFAGFKFPYKNCSGLERSNPEEYLLGGSSHPNARLHEYYAICIDEWLRSDVLTLINAWNPHP